MAQLAQLDKWNRWVENSYGNAEAMKRWRGLALDNVKDWHRVVHIAARINPRTPFFPRSSETTRMQKLVKSRKGLHTCAHLKVSGH